MFRLAELELDAVPTSAPYARHFIREVLDQWEVPHLKELAVLLTTELVTNGIVHASTQLQLITALANVTPEIRVTDLAPHRGVPLAPQDDRAGTRDDADSLREGGRGLVLVDALSDGWGVVMLPQGKCVWCRLNAEIRAPSSPSGGGDYGEHKYDVNHNDQPAR